MTAVAAGLFHSVALLGDGTVRAWGSNWGGQLGDGTTAVSSTPVQVIYPFDPTGFLTEVTAVAAGNGHTVAVRDDGLLRAWGYNENGQLGNGTTSLFATPTPVRVVDPSDPTGLLTGGITVAAGYFHTVALLRDGTVRAWGGNFSGQVGDGTTTASFTPVRVVDPSDPTGFLTGVAAISACLVHTVALR
ncbi:MAG: hypothetical protein O7H41_01660 [Planctomycetota bacterium]|nr:hypothetical protein [Planctomycetota bacterium]